MFLRASGWVLIQHPLTTVHSPIFLAFFKWPIAKGLREKTSADINHNQAMHNAPK